MLEYYQFLNTPYNSLRSSIIGLNLALNELLSAPSWFQFQIASSNYTYLLQTLNSKLLVEISENCSFQLKPLFRI